MHKKTTDDGQLSLFEPAEEKIIKQEYSDIMKQSYIDYAMSVIIAVRVKFTHCNTDDTCRFSVRFIVIQP